MRAWNVLPVVLPALLLAASCGSPSTETTTAARQESTSIATTEAPTTSPPIEEDAESQDPPQLFLRSSKQEIVPAWIAYCWAVGEGICADYGPTARPVISTEAVIEIVWPLEGWDFSVRPADLDICQPGIATVRRVGPTPMIAIDGKAARYDLELEGRGPEGQTNYSFAVDYTGAGTSTAVGSIALLSLVRDGENAVTLTGAPNNVAVTKANVTFLAGEGREITRPMEILDNGDCSAVLVTATGTASAAQEFGPPPWEFILEIELSDGREFHTNGFTAFWAQTLPPAQPINLRPIDEPLGKAPRSSLLSDDTPDG